MMVRALREFVAEKNELPLSGELPDMTATSDLYVTMQRLYWAQAAEDVANVTGKVHALLTSVGLPADHISEDEIKLACKNARFLRVLRYHAVSGEYALDATTKGCVQRGRTHHHAHAMAVSPALSPDACAVLCAGRWRRSLRM